MLPVRHRRRFKGLRADEVAELAGFSTRWYLYFESGRAQRRFSLEFIERIADVLRLESHDRARFLELALPTAIGDRQRGLAPSVQQAILGRRLGIARGLRGAIARRELAVVYQPIWEVSGRRIRAVEALLRWQSAELGAVPPGEFVSAAEDLGLIRQLGDFVLREACYQAASWRRQNLPEFRLCVNLSPAQLSSRRFARQLCKLLKNVSLPAQILDLEITETRPLSLEPATLSTITECTSLGVRFSIDDFGMGYSSLRNLRALRAHSLKIDRYFVSDLPEDPFATAIIRAVITLAHSLGLVVVAEGVEREEQRMLLEAMGCDELQGFLVGKPLSATECGALLEQSLLLDYGDHHRSLCDDGSTPTNVQ